jgi:uncharacterized protein DUF4352
MNRLAWLRMIASIAAAALLAGWIYESHPGWFRNHSSFTMPLLAARPTAVHAVHSRSTATPAVPRVGTTQHLDGIWITPMRIAPSQGANGILPNLGDQFLIVSLRIVNRTQFDYSVHASDFQVLDGHGELNPALTKDFTRKGLRAVVLIPQGHTIGTLIFEVPQHSKAVTLIYQHDTLDPSKRKEWQLNDSSSN